MQSGGGVNEFNLVGLVGKQKLDERFSSRDMFIFASGTGPGRQLSGQRATV